MKMPTNRSRSAFTLTELMVALAVAGVISLIFASFMKSNLSLNYFTAGKINVGKDVRDFTVHLSDAGRMASDFRIFPSFQDRTESVSDGRSGDYLVFYYTDENNRLVRLIGFYRSGAQGEESSVRWHDLKVKGDEDVLTLPSPNELENFPVILHLTRGMADGRLFANFYEQSVMVSGEIIHPGDRQRRATNFYNFTVSPRG